MTCRIKIRRASLTTPKHAFAIKHASQPRQLPEVTPEDQLDVRRIALDVVLRHEVPEPLGHDPSISVALLLPNTVPVPVPPDAVLLLKYEALCFEPRWSRLRGWSWRYLRLGRAARTRSGSFAPPAR